MSNRPEPRTEERFLTAPSEAERTSFGDAFERLVAVMARLYGPGGCPWDRAQTLGTLRSYLLEETYEVLDALERGRVLDHREELGDLLLQVVFQAELRRAAGEFDAADVAHGIADKLVRRHPHVFGAEDARDPEHAFSRWEAMKAEEKPGRSVLDGVPKRLPALLRAQRVGAKASRVGFDWNGVEGPLEKVDEELVELRAAIEGGEKSRIVHELGDVLFSVVNAARFLDVVAEDALREAVDRFEMRFHSVEQVLRARGRRPQDATLEEMEEAWQEAKAQSA